MILDQMTNLGESNAFCDHGCHRAQAAARRAKELAEEQGFRVLVINLGTSARWWGKGLGVNVIHSEAGAAIATCIACALHTCSIAVEIVRLTLMSPTCFYIICIGAGLVLLSLRFQLAYTISDQLQVSLNMFRLASDRHTK